jgi:hypothetical protein
VPNGDSNKDVFQWEENKSEQQTWYFEGDDVIRVRKPLGYVLTAYSWGNGARLRVVNVGLLEGRNKWQFEIVN